MVPLRLAKSCANSFMVATAVHCAHTEPDHTALSISMQLLLLEPAVLLSQLSAECIGAWRWCWCWKAGRYLIYEQAHEVSPTVFGTHATLKLQLMPCHLALLLQAHSQLLRQYSFRQRHQGLQNELVHFLDKTLLLVLVRIAIL